MKRRLTIAILGTVAAALILAGLGTLLLARVGARNATEADLRRQAETTADLVGFGSSRIGAISDQDLETIRGLICRSQPPGPSPSTTAPPRDAGSQLRTIVCAGGDQTPEQVQAELCVGVLPRVISAMPEDVRKARAAFCDSPTDENLGNLHTVFCDAGSQAKSTAARQAIERYRRLACAPLRRQSDQKAQLQDTLSKESIDMVTISDRDEVVSGSLPAGLTLPMMDLPRLRAGETISGENGVELFAAAPVNTGPGDISAIVIQRNANPIRDSVQWFLVAAGLTLAIGTFVAAWLSRRLTSPLREATALTVKIAGGDLSSRLPEHALGSRAKRDEIDELAHSINAMAEALERSKGLERQFLLSVSHDLRTPLTSIRGYAEALADGAAPDPERAANVILAESRRLERLVKDLLDLAKLDARRFTLNVVQVDLVELAADSVDGFRREVDQHGLTIALSAPSTPLLAYADPDRLQQIIANLVENALKFSSSLITVSVSGDADAPRIEVIDDGPGIPGEDLPHVFERLYVAAATVKRKETGSGLGLAIVRELVEAMGGTVRAEPNPAGGTRMVVALSPTPPPPVAGLPDAP